MPAKPAVQITLGTPSPEATTTPTPVEDVPTKTADGISMGGAALGGNAETVLLGQEILTDMPDGSLVWIAYEATLADAQSIEHTHEFAFLYAVEG